MPAETERRRPEGAEPVVEHAHGDARLRALEQRLPEPASDAVVVDDVDDLRHATEVVITDQDRVRLDSPLSPAERRRQRGRRRLSRAVGGSANRVLKDVAMAGSVLGSAVRGYRELGPHERWALVFFAGLAVAVGLVAILWPGVVAWPVAVVGLWLGISLLVRAWHLSRSRGAGAAGPPGKPTRQTRRPS